MSAHTPSENPFDLSPAGLILCDGIQSRDTELAASARERLIALHGDERLAFEFAERNEVACILGHRHVSEAMRPGVDFALDLFGQAHEKVRQRMQSYMAELDAVAAELDRHDIPLVALKNSGIVRGIYPCAGCCPMGDIDVLVRRSDFRRAHDVLVALGFHFEFRSTLEKDDLDEAERTGGTEYRKQLASGETLWFELQWRAVSGRWIRPDQEPETDRLMARTVPVPGSAVRLLSPADNLLQVALHTAKHSYVRAPGFRLHTDVDRVVQATDVPWDAFVRSAKERQVATATYFSLLIPSLILGTPIPPDVLSELRPSPRKVSWMIGTLRRAGLLEPHAPKFGRWQYLRFTAELYDDPRPLLRGIWPDRATMEKQYGPANAWRLFGQRLGRLKDLAFRRNAT
ncbi:MAG: nucleotidyltransferase family protein [Planctomycetales bacterium]|nr:nucleotidyltransferase family protein [Planctomycetales bacterium]